MPCRRVRSVFHVALSSRAGGRRQHRRGREAADPQPVGPAAVPAGAERLERWRRRGAGVATAARLDAPVDAAPRPRDPPAARLQIRPRRRQRRRVSATSATFFTPFVRLGTSASLLLGGRDRANQVFNLISLSWTSFSWTSMSWTSKSWISLSWICLSWTSLSWTSLSWISLSWFEQVFFKFSVTFAFEDFYFDPSQVFFLLAFTSFFAIFLQESPKNALYLLNIFEVV